MRLPKFNKITRLLIGFLSAAVVLCTMVPTAVRASAPAVSGTVETQTGAGMGDMWVKWQDKYGSTRYMKTNPSGGYSFPGWQTMTDAARLDEQQQLIDIWRLGATRKEFVYIDGTALGGDGGAWGCREDPHRLSVILPSSVNCEKIVVDRADANISKCQNISLPLQGCFDETNLNHYYVTQAGGCQNYANSLSPVPRVRQDWLYGYLAIVDTIDTNPLILKKKTTADGKLKTRLTIDFASDRIREDTSYTGSEKIGIVYNQMKPGRKALHECYINIWDDYMLAAFDSTAQPTDYCRQSGEEYIGVIGYIDAVQTVDTISMDTAINPVTGQPNQSEVCITRFPNDAASWTLPSFICQPKALACGTVTLTPATVTADSVSSPTLSCTAAGGSLPVAYKRTIPSNVATGTPLTEMIPALVAGSMNFSVSNLNPGSYTVSCLPCLDATGTNCAPTTPSCSTTLTVTDGCRLGQVSNVASVINFKIVSGVYRPVVVNWKQAIETPVKTDYFDIQFYPASRPGTSLGPIRVAREVAAVADSPGNYSLTLADTPTSTPVRELHEMLKSAFQSAVIIEVTPVEAGDVSCPAKIGVEQLGTAIIPTTTEVTVKVRDGECSGNDLPAITGKLSATWTGGSGGPTNSTDLSIKIPTGSPLTSTYTFDSDLYSCNLACTDDISTAAQKKCQKTGYSDTTLETVVYISQQNISGWWEAVGGLAYGREMGSSLPLNLLKKPLVCPETGPEANSCAPYLMRSPIFTPDLLAGIPLAANLTVTSGWETERSVTQTRASGLNGADFKNSLNKGSSAYNHFKSLVPVEKLTTTSITSLNSLAVLPATGGKPSYYVVTGDLQINPTSTIVIGAGQKYILFVEGSLTVGEDSFGEASLQQLIKIENGGFLAVFVNNTMTIKPSVGSYINPNVEPSAAIGIGSSPTANLAGIFIADDTLTVEANGSSTIPDKRFVGEGTFASATSIDLQREFNRGDILPFSKIIGGYTPTEVFRHRPDIVLATPIELKVGSTQYQEVR